VHADDGEHAWVSLGQREGGAAAVDVGADRHHHAQVVVEGGGEIVDAVEVAVGVDHASKGSASRRGRLRSRPCRYALRMSDGAVRRSRRGASLAWGVLGVWVVVACAPSVTEPAAAAYQTPQPERTAASRPLEVAAPVVSTPTARDVRVAVLGPDPGSNVFVPEPHGVGDPFAVPDVTLTPRVEEPSAPPSVRLPPAGAVEAAAVPWVDVPLGWRQDGVASWYGPNFAGRSTANGEVFDPSGLTAAHRTLPFGTLVRVTNLENDRAVVVRINDRGPFVHDRVIDLSQGAAEVIGLIGLGTARVRLEPAGEVEGRRTLRIDPRLTGYDVILVGVAAGTLLVIEGEQASPVLVRAADLGAPMSAGANGLDVWVSESLAATLGREGYVRAQGAVHQAAGEDAR